MESIIIGIHVLAAIAITGLVLMQSGKGADMGASFGSGASQTMFGSAGSGNFLTKATTWMTIMFFLTSLGLAVVAKQRSELGVQDSSLISGNIDQITSGLSVEEETLLESLVDQIDEIGDIPVVVEDISAESDGDVPIIVSPAISEEE